MSGQSPDGGGPESESEALSPSSSWQPRVTDIKSSVEKYSRFVSTMKIALPSFAGLLLAVVIILPQLRGEPDQLSVEISVTSDETGTTLSLVNARYLGTDTSGQPFSVTAQSVREAVDDNDTINLTAPQADISLNDGTWLMVGADTGQYHRETQMLRLDGEVNLFQDQGYEMHTDSATVMLEQGSASSSTPVRSQGPFGQLESQGFKLQEKGKVVFFTGPARLVLNSAGQNSGNP